MIEQLNGMVKSLYVLVCFAVFILLVAAFIVRTRRGGYNKAWAPLTRVLHGTVKSQHMTSTMTGEYRSHPVRATIASGGQDMPDTFTVGMPAGPGGRDWEIAHRSESLLGAERWRALTKDPALQARLDAAQVGSYLQGWPEHAHARYDAKAGTLSIREDIFAPTPEHFRAQLAMLESLVEANRQLNSENG